MQTHQSGGRRATGRRQNPREGARTAAALILPLLLAACGLGSAGATGPSPSPAVGHFPVSITAPGGTTVTLARRPVRIVSLSPTATEMLFALGAGKQVVAVDDQSNYPAQAPVTKLSGFQPNVEAIAGYTPDLVVASEDPGGMVQGLAQVSVPTLLEPAAKNLDDSYTQVRQLGDATGHVGEAAALVARMRADIARIVASVGRPSRKLSVYHELDDTRYSATSKTFIGQVYTLLGLTNIADAAAGAAPDYPQLSSEFIISASPDLIVLADTRCCHQDAAAVAARPGWTAIAAVKNSQVVAADDDVASRWGPRVVDFIRLIATHVSQLQRTALPLPTG
ncbi:MAG TPA: ABC transporter substrate-binding protein [Candidatus Dormibacteraeota bacterium]|jgi:iron complex transport system substrate-binding protein|nr:ABC transporter substrate-binding protein [Candidatus Dormibacteraeota bacterium]